MLVKLAKVREMGDSEVGETGKVEREFICLNCGHRFFSTEKLPKCPVCQRRRVIPFEDFKNAVKELAKNDDEIKGLIADEVLSTPEIEEILKKYRPEIEAIAEKEEEKEGTDKAGQEGNERMLVTVEDDHRPEPIKPSVEPHKPNDDAPERPAVKKSSKSRKKKSGFSIPWTLVGIAVIGAILLWKWEDIQKFLEELKAKAPSEEPREPVRSSSSMLKVINKNIGAWPR